MPTAPALDDSVFDGRTVLVTGAGRGIGRAVALELGERGASVHCVARSDAVVETAALVTKRGGRASASRGSVADEAFCRRVVEETVPDVVVNAAAVLGPSGSFTALSMHDFGEVLSVNLVGTATIMRHALPGMLDRGFGRVVNFAGGGAAYAYPGFAPYAVSKAAVVRLTETVAREIADEHPGADVTVNVIAPGAVETDMLADVRRRGGEVRTVVDIAEPVALVAYLASAAAAHISGRFIHVRDDYRDRSLFEDPDMLTLRRVERR